MTEREEIEAAEARFHVAREGYAIERELATSATIRMLIQRAAAEKAAALDSIAAVDPADEPALRSAVLAYQRANEIGRWIRDAIQNGATARELIEGDALLETGQGEDNLPA